MTILNTCTKKKCGNLLKAPRMFIICVDNALRTSIDLIEENGFTPTQKKKTKAKANNIPQKLLYMQTTQMIKRFYAITLVRAESRVHSLEQAASI